MSKKLIYLIILITVVLSLIVNVLFGRALSVKVSTLPLLNRWKIVSPMAPIVINTREEIRVNDSQDIVQAISAVRPKLSLVIFSDGEQIKILGAALNLTSDGLFVTTKSAIENQKIPNIYVKLDNGAVSQVSSIYQDSATGLVILRASFNGVSVADLASSKNAQAGQRIFFLSPGLADFTPAFAAGFVAQPQTESLAVGDSDAPRRTFNVQGADGLLAGEAVADTRGAILGIWDGRQVVSSDIIKNLSEIYLGNHEKIIRPSFGFNYQIISAVESKLTGQLLGVKVTGVDAGGQAQKAGLISGDVIQSWDGTVLNGAASLEELLQKYKPGDKAGLRVMRGKSQLNLTLAVGQAK